MKTAGAVLSIFVAVLMMVVSGPALALTFREPAKGSAERAAIMDTLRPAVEAEMRGPVEFVVTTIRVTPNWAFVQVEPQRPGGGVIDPEETGFAGDADMMDGLTVYGLMGFQAGRWNLIDHMVGPTDVGYAVWQQRYGVPAALLGLE
ncbi:hypothetical protein [Rhizobium sp. PL01]|jgi:hypothetical protein|uniref:hypothetical protein n=1 Tax=Rhizobium sp. PL01 TaxID=3085631 RepID=UPI002981D084|nr:hypothetical protein [Rhizobium sp. PL01]MDW5315817.1 hypothetical protein [Rhizobium sp. PL01]